MNSVLDKNEGTNRGERAAPTCDHGLSRRPLRVKSLLRVELESKSDDKQTTTINVVTFFSRQFVPLSKSRRSRRGGKGGRPDQPVILNVIHTSDRS